MGLSIAQAHTNFGEEISVTKQTRDYWQQFFGDIILVMVTLHLAMMLLEWDGEWAWRFLAVAGFAVAAIGLSVVSLGHLFWHNPRSLTTEQTADWLYLLNEHSANPMQNWWTWSKGLLVGLAILMVAISLSADLINLPPTTNLFLGLDSAAIALGIVGVNILRWLLTRGRRTARKG